MLEALKKINELAQVLQQRIEFNNRVGKETEDRAAKLNEKDTALNAREKDLDAREEKIKPIENTISLRELAAKEKKEAEELLAAFQKEKNAFNEFVSKTRGQMAEERTQLDIDKAKVDKENVLIRKEWEEIEKMKLNMKAEIMNEIIRGNLK